MSGAGPVSNRAESAHVLVQRRLLGDRRHRRPGTSGALPPRPLPLIPSQVATNPHLTQPQSRLLPQSSGAHLCLPVAQAYRQAGHEGARRRRLDRVHSARSHGMARVAKPDQRKLQIRMVESSTLLCCPAPPRPAPPPPLPRPTPPRPAPPPPVPRPAQVAVLKERGIALWDMERPTSPAVRLIGLDGVHLPKPAKFRRCQYAPLLPSQCRSAGPR